MLTVSSVLAMYLVRFAWRLEHFARHPLVKKHGKVEKRQKFVKARGRSAKPRVAVFLILQHTHVCRCKDFLLSKIDVSLLTPIVGIYEHMSCLLTRA